MSVATASVDHAGADQVDDEVAGPGADLERAPEARRLAAQRLAELAQHLALALGVVGDAPLGVVARGRQVVVADVGVEDLSLLPPCGAGSLRRAIHSRVRERSDRPAGPARGRPAAGPHRRADDARRAGGELLVPPPPGRVRVDRGPLRRPRRGGHGLRRGLRHRGAGAGAPARSRAWTPTPRPTSTPSSSTRGRASASSATWWRRHHQECDAVVFLQTIEHVERPEEVLRHFRVDAAPGRRRLRVHAQPAHAGPARAPTSRTTPGTCASTASRSSARCARRCSTASSSTASSTRASCACTSWRCAPGWDRVHAALGITKPFYDRFTPAIASGDFALRTGRPRAGARLRGRAAPPG